MWEVLMEMERFNRRAKAEDRAVALVLDLAKAFERVSFLVVWAWATHFCFPRKILRVLCGEHQRRVQFEGCAAEPLPGSKSDLLSLTHCSARCVRRSHKSTRL